MEPSWSAEDSDLLEKASAWLDQAAEGYGQGEAGLWYEPGQELDWATAVVYQGLRRHARHAEFWRRVRRIEFGRGVEDATLVPQVGLVPGAFYRNHRNTGADGAAIARMIRAMGWGVEVVPVASFGSCLENARTLLAWLRKQTRPVMLVSLSKGSLDVKAALSLAGAGCCLSCVHAWVSVSGLWQGTPLVGWLARHRWRQLAVRIVLRCRGQRYAVVEELAPERQSAIPEIPGTWQVVHVLGVPLRRHLSHPWAFRGYDRLASLGPNDGGGILLKGTMDWPGAVYPVWGADHYLQPSWDVEPLLHSIFRTAYLGGVQLRQAQESAAAPNKPPATKSHA